jgi:photosystem II stability/assembly factor-like uncharacterized protein
MRVTPLIFYWALGFAAVAQEAPPAVQPTTLPIQAPALTNTGKPMLLPFRCSEEDIHWAGLSCTEEEPCPVFLELAAAEQGGNRIVTVGNIHTESVTLYSVLLASDDGGRTWSEANDRIRGAGLDHIQFFGADRGWVLGQELFPIPQDPFLLITADGGKTWQQKSIFNEAAENHFGGILQFSFSGKNEASLVIDRGRSSPDDRYVLFESPDAGENWAVKQESSKPLQLKNPAVPSGDWRIRADAPNKSFQVEHRQGTRWVSVGAFLVKLDPCKPPSN